MARLRCILLMALAAWLGPAQAQEFVDDALRPLFHAELLAQQVGDACAALEPALGSGIATGLAHLREAHGPELAAGREAAARRTGPRGLAGLAQTLARRFQARLQRQDAAGQRTECAALATWLETSAARSRRELVEESFRKWFARQQQARQVQCARLHEATQSLSRRLLSGVEPAPDVLRADARMAEHAAGWCQQVQATAEREGIRIPGDFAGVRETARAIAEAALPQLSGRDPAAVLRHGRERARRYLAEPQWI